MVAAFSLAVLTDRLLLVEAFTYGETKSISDLFKSPGFDIEFALPSAPGRRYQNLNLDMDIEEIRSMVEFYVCTDFNNFASNSVIRLSGTNYITTFLFKNPFFQSKIR